MRHVLAVATQDNYSDVSEWDILLRVMRHVLAVTTQDSCSDVSE